MPVLLAYEYYDRLAQISCIDTLIQTPKYTNGCLQRHVHKSSSLKVGSEAAANLPSAAAYPRIDNLGPESSRCQVVPRRFHTLYTIRPSSTSNLSSRNNPLFYRTAQTHSVHPPKSPTRRNPIYSCAQKHDLLSSREPKSIHLVTRCLSTDLLLYRPPLLV